MRKRGERRGKRGEKDKAGKREGARKRKSGERG